MFIEKIFCRKVFGNSKRDSFPKLSDLYLCEWCLLRFYIQICRSNKFHSPIKKDQSEGQLKTLVFDNQIVSAMQRRDKLYKKFKHSGLQTDKDNFKATKKQFQKMILKKKKSYFEEELDKNRNKPKELWKALKSLDLSLEKVR